ncbi:MAG: FAD-binding protein, partial [Methanomicrobia archaeon]|nr:FAD-binding protein [Methanomicrobia archaeon]
MIECDALVIGGGGAGARAALEAKKRGAKVCLVTKGKFGETGSTNFVASETLGINAAFGYEDERDNPEIHLKDTIETGLKVYDEKMAKILAYEA